MLHVKNILKTCDCYFSVQHDVYGAHPKTGLMTLGSNVDANLIYTPPSTLQLPDGSVVDLNLAHAENKNSSRPDSPQSSNSSRSDVSSPILNRDMDMEFQSQQALISNQVSNS